MKDVKLETWEDLDYAIDNIDDINLDCLIKDKSTDLDCTINDSSEKVILDNVRPMYCNGLSMFNFKEGCIDRNFNVIINLDKSNVDNAMEYHFLGEKVIIKKESKINELEKGLGIELHEINESNSFNSLLTISDICLTCSNDNTEVTTMIKGTEFAFNTHNELAKFKNLSLVKLDNDYYLKGDAFKLVMYKIFYSVQLIYRLGVDRFTEVFNQYNNGTYKFQGRDYEILLPITTTLTSLFDINSADEFINFINKVTDDKYNLFDNESKGYIFCMKKLLYTGNRLDKDYISREEGENLLDTRVGNEFPEFYDNIYGSVSLYDIRNYLGRQMASVGTSSYIIKGLGVEDNFIIVDYCIDLYKEIDKLIDCINNSETTCIITSTVEGFKSKVLSYFVKFFYNKELSDDEMLSEADYIGLFDYGMLKFLKGEQGITNWDIVRFCSSYDEKLRYLISTLYRVYDELDNDYRYKLDTLVKEHDIYIRPKADVVSDKKDVTSSNGKMSLF